MVRDSRLRNSVLLALGFILMMSALYMVFAYVPTEKSTGIVQRIFYFHVPVAWVSFLAFLVTFIYSILYLRKRDLKWDAVASASAEIGVVFTTLVLITGPIWAKPAWGIWWTWDARLTTSLLLWLIYIGYLLVRSLTSDRARAASYSAVIGIVGFIDVPIVFLTVNLWRTQHPTTIVFEGGLTPPMLLTLIVSVAAFTVLYFLLLVQNTGLKSLEEKIRHLKGMTQAE